MSYEIPQELQYKEIIMFGLTGGQIGFALLFGFPVLFIFFKTNLPLSVKIILGSPLIFIGIMFMFFKFKDMINSIFFYLSFRKAEIFSQKMKEYLPIKKIEDSVITIQHKKTKKKISIIEIKPLNYKIRNIGEREAIISGFQRFLDSLEFPIQIIIATEPLNIDEYLKSLEERVDAVIDITKNPDYEKHFISFKEHIENTIKTSSLMNRKFFIAIPEKESIGINIQTEICKDELKNLGITVKSLDREEITGILSGFFNDNLNENDTKPDVKEISTENFLHRIIAPNHIQNNPDHIKIDNKFSRIIAITGYPRAVEPGFLDRIISTMGDFDISIHIEPFPIETTMLMLNREIQKQSADLYASKIKGVMNHSLEIKYADTKFAERK